MRGAFVLSGKGSNGVLGCIRATETASSQADATHSALVGGNAQTFAGKAKRSVVDQGWPFVFGAEVVGGG